MTVIDLIVTAVVAGIALSTCEIARNFDHCESLPPL